ncbi:RWD domain-containing protein 2A [Leptinotarsa decemlineata]|uniref:RWD domain-containing protein 2A n=1 Tax=Leptinotarsa decemlineata TaxID=7539 RepID=UPI000C251984|nr:RWD domain-containing protein 2A [Leptinotarsa decemlineata]
MDKISTEKLKENLQTQLSELESLQSVFCNPGEVKVEDICTLADITDFVADKSTFLPQYLDLVIKLVIDDLKFELCVTLPHEYPHAEPEIFIRSPELNRSTHIQLNKNINEFITSQEKGEPCIFSAISWLQDNAGSYVSVKEETSPQKDAKNEKFVRYWIYSHHIYSRTKRKEIVDLANQLSISGFCMPGKPGIICVEGSSSSCTEWWQSIRSMTWKKIFLKVEEEDKEQLGQDFLKFDKFEEVVFQNSGVKFNHMDMGELHRYLESRGVGYIFKDLFGVEAKSSSQ